MTALALLLCVPALMWLVQSAMLKHYGLPLRWRIDAGDAPKQLRLVGRIATQVLLIALILLFPTFQGRGIEDYYGCLLPLDRTASLAGQGAAIASLFLCALYITWIATDRIYVAVHQSRRKWTRRLILLIPTACFGALVEELIFRGILMADLLQTPWLHPAFAVAISVFVFAAAHYVRTPKRVWTFSGHLALGLALCMAFLQTRTLWLPAGLHAGGILMIMGTRPFFRYQGPAWLTGASIFPFAGVLGIGALLLMTGLVWTHYGIH